MSVHLPPEEIEAESFRIIAAELGEHPWSEREWQVVRRAIHTSADFDYARSMCFSAGAIDRALAAIKAGKGIVSDTTMVLAGVSKARLAPFGCRTSCFVADPEVAREAKELGITRSILAMRKGAANPANSIFLIGNAPTALFELMRLIRDEGVRPSLVVGLPVGFVGAAESKEELMKLSIEMPDLPVITNHGRKGGSNVAAAVMNALLILAEGR